MWTNYRREEERRRNRHPAQKPLKISDDPEKLVDEPGIPEGFDVGEFLESSRELYIRLQKLWDERNLDEIAKMSSPAVIRKLREQARSDPNPSRTELININVRFRDAEAEGDNMRARARFDVLMKEYADRPAENVAEIWHFLRIGKDGEWRLDGIQQIA